MRAAIANAAVLVLWTAAACDATLPDVAPARFACTDDLPLSGGELPCGADARCAEGLCRPRLGCDEVDGFEGCRREVRRCEPVVTEALAAVRCEGGIHTQTSTRPTSFETCDCPDGLHCVAFVDSATVGAADRPLDLRFLPSGGAALPGETPERRLCVRACSVEENCSANHTCRPAALERSGGGGDPRRDNLAVCYPDILPETSTVTPTIQVVTGACQQAEDCPGAETCEYRVVVVPPHPRAPSEDWRGRRALVARCILDNRLGQPSCTDGNNCRSGICVDGRCRAPCDPRAPQVACGNNNCVEREAERGTPTGPVVDRVRICDE